MNENLRSSRYQVCREWIEAATEMRRCKDCAMQFDKPSEYSKHRRQHSAFLCQACGKLFGLMKKLRYHVRGCPKIGRKRGYDSNRKSGSVHNFSEYKRLAGVTAKELDAEFEVYLERKFGKKSFFRNEKMCKFCCQTFAMASDFADHIREHYKSIALDATGVKSKCDFMKFMGLKIREEDQADCSDLETINKRKNQPTTECRVVIVGERCEICSKSVKCLTDLDEHKKVHHPKSIYKRNEVTLVLKIGEEIISRIPLKKSYVRGRASKVSHYRAKRKRVRFDLDVIEDYPCKSGGKGKEVGTCSTGTGRKPQFPNCERVTRREKNSQSILASEKKECRLDFQNENCNPADDNGTRSPRVASGKEVTEYSQETTYGFETQTELESRQIYADELFERMQSYEPWKEEPWCSNMRLEEGVASVEDDDCYCIEPPLISKEEKSAWEQEHYDSLNRETGNCPEVIFLESPPIYKYSCDPDYQADFSFPTDEISRGFEVKKIKKNEKVDNSEENNNYIVDQSFFFDYKASITIQNEENNSHPVIQGYADELYEYHDLEARRAADVMKKYPESLIKEEVMLED